MLHIHALHPVSLMCNMLSRSYNSFALVLVIYSKNVSRNELVNFGVASRKEIEIKSCPEVSCKTEALGRNSFIFGGTSMKVNIRIKVSVFFRQSIILLTNLGRKGHESFEAGFTFILAHLKYVSGVNMLRCDVFAYHST